MRARLNGPLIVAFGALFAVLLTLDPGDSRPSFPEGPGLTVDEVFNVQMGVYLVESLRAYGVAIVDPRSLLEIFGDQYNPDHPPLGRLWLGCFHAVGQTLTPPHNVEGPFVTVSARIGSAVAFAFTVLLAGLFARRHFGSVAGTAAALSLAVMPRLFGHAHLASLETVTNFTWLASLLSVAHWWLPQTTPSEPLSSRKTDATPRRATLRFAEPSNRVAILTGIVFGLALLTKIQAIILPVLIGVWALWNWRWKAIRPVCLWSATGLAVFVLGWPWLWHDLPGHLHQYFVRTTQRAVLHCFYLGTVFDDRAVPWHYPLVLFAGTVPVITHAFAGFGLRSSRSGLVSGSRELLLLGAVVAPLVLFALPGVAVYDGERLFLVAFPAWAIFAGRGAAALFEHIARHRRLALTALLLLQSMGLLASPHWLSWYSGAVGFLPGASKLGLEVDYWGAGFTRTFLRKVIVRTQPGDRVAVAPVLHAFQLSEMERQLPMLRQHSLMLVPFDQEDSTAEWLMVFARRADAPSDELLQKYGWVPVDDVRSQGVILARLWMRSATASR